MLNLVDTHQSIATAGATIASYMYLLYDYYCMSNLIGPLLGNILPYCTGTGGYCTVHVGRHGNK